MKTALGITVWLAISTLASAAVSIGKQEQRPSFRSGTSAVLVSVSVRDGNRPVRGLLASDFALTDNGVEQSIERMDVDSVPIDLTLVLDVSGSAKSALSDTQKDAAQILGMLRPVDRVRVLTIGSSVSELVPWQLAEAVRLPDLELGETSAVYDAIVAALVGRSEAGRRRVAVVITDGADSASVADLTSLLALARRSEVALYVIATAAIRVPPPMFRKPAMPVWPELRLDRLAEVASVTGGLLKDVPTWGGANAASAFRSVFDMFRLSYLLSYAPQGVGTTGWHDVTVRLVETRKNYAIDYRRGYFAGPGGSTDEMRQSRR